MSGNRQKSTRDVRGRSAGGVGEAPRRLELKITSDPANLRHVRKEIEKFAAHAGMPAEVCDNIGLVINEALANIIRHGYGGATDKPIEVVSEFGGIELRITLRDWAKPFDPSDHLKEPDPANLTPGGLGLMCMRKLMDDVKWEKLPDGMRLTMIKRK